MTVDRTFKAGAAWLLIAFFSLGGCVSRGDWKGPQPDYRMHYPAPPEAVWESLVRTVKDLPLQETDAEKMRMETEWMEGWSRRPFGAFRGGVMGGEWKRRVKLIFQLVPLSEGGTELRVVSRVQEKAPGGTQAYGWRPAGSDGKMEKGNRIPARRRIAGGGI